MKIQKKHLFVGIPIMAVLLLELFGLFTGDRWGTFHHRSHKFLHPDFAEHFLSSMDKKVEFLKLSKEQQEQYKGIRSKIESRHSIKSKTKESSWRN